ncbi:magnesium protoporphyrin IX methyltransferase [Halorhodospira halochloris]|uniref:magnesium protoporphyrin IX methyltransferase n=1 Tax=Halorhodospira halochloris TaxID=1052 RepID=UPI001EE970A2|nr:magnesium protoporphyrin IX methyltransferase [Halorhodospira halochloris]MCG5530208.1 magnesium protoporphyrin IX methyltransferase [Halorhodospira halochloris]MCG5548066.1 magnesium protoporphyrin IX methyltransferase [Halorhodospira halochloris]
MPTSSYKKRLGKVETYFDDTAVDAWRKLTSDAPVSGVRATVRAGREEMRTTLLSWLPSDMRGKRVLDAGCGPGMLSYELARRGAQVTAIDVSSNLIDIARQRLPEDIDSQRIDFQVGDMLDSSLGEFDYVVSMDVLIHYPCDDAVAALADIAQRTRGSIAFTFAPRTPFLAAMHWVGKLFPRSDRSPAIEPVAQRRLLEALAGEERLEGWKPGRSQLISRGFYTSQALELQRQ